MTKNIENSGLIDAQPHSPVEYLEEMLEGLASFAMAHDLPATSALITASAKLADQEYRATPMPQDPSSGPDETLQP